MIASNHGQHMKVSRICTVAVALIVGLTQVPAAATATADAAVISSESPVPHDTTDTCSPLADPLGLRNYEFTPSLAVDPGQPKHLVATWLQDFRDAAPIAVSRDGGSTWVESVPPGFLACANGPGGDVAAIDPHIAVGPDSAVYAVVILQDASGSNDQVIFSGSRDGGTTWLEHPVVLDTRVVGTRAIEYATVVTDPTRPGVAYAAWDRHESIETAAGGTISRGDQYVVRTLDWGATWTPVPLVAPSGRVWSIASLAVLSDGTVLDAFTDIPAGAAVPGVTAAPEGSVRVARLAPGASSWSVAEQAIGAGVVPYADIAVNDNVVYVAAYSQAADAAAAVIARSDDGGRTFLAPSPFVAPTTLLNLAVTPRGNLGVLYDVVRDNAYEVHLARSQDGGRTYDDQLVAGPMDPSTLPIVGSAENGGIGGYQSMRADRGDWFVAAITLVNTAADAETRGPTDVVFRRFSA